MTTTLNQLSGGLRTRAKRIRVGRGIGCTKGKTCGRGHKGQLSRSGSGIKPGFEGGQMPLQRRLPKFGFTARVSRHHEVLTLAEIAKVKGDEVSLKSLIEANLVPDSTRSVKVILSGEIKRSVQIASGIKLTKGAKQAVLDAGGKVQEEA